MRRALAIVLVALGTVGYAALDTFDLVPGILTRTTTQP